MFADAADPGAGAVAALHLPGHRAEPYAQAVAEIEHLPGTSPDEAALCLGSHLTPTRFLPCLLDRTDRLGTGVGLEVRVPFLDHRLVDCVFNIDWAMKNRDGREKSLLRAAMNGLLPDPCIPVGLAAENVADVYGISRLTTTALTTLRHDDHGTALVTVVAAGGQGMAMVIERTEQPLRKDRSDGAGGTECPWGAVRAPETQDTVQLTDTASNGRWWYGSHGSRTSVGPCPTAAPGTWAPCPRSRCRGSRAHVPTAISAVRRTTPRRPTCPLRDTAIEVGRTPVKDHPA
ncbi:asparagine synthase-related protein [Streptomyces hydrogenans]|uniref:asparagine synthase-related protein n=1 Tax=Streptomyces hydrogenans TaxID=1873719 RepID=UPI00382D7F1B